MNEILKTIQCCSKQITPIHFLLYYDRLQIAVVLHSEDAILLDYVKIDLIAHCLGDLSNFLFFL